MKTAYDPFEPPEVDADKEHAPGFTKEEFKQGFSSTPMYGEYGGPANKSSVRWRRYRKESEDAS